MFRLVRFWSRRWAGGLAQGATTESHVAHVLVLEAIDAASSADAAKIDAVAAELGLDRSNASRLLTAAVSAGLVTKTVSRQDARRTEIAFTHSGAQMLGDARAWQEQKFAELTAEWSAADARRFASYLIRLADQPLKEQS